MYAIARYIPRQIRQTVADEFETRFRPHGYCPLGAVSYLAADDDHKISRTPGPFTFSDTVQRHRWTEEDPIAVRSHTARFMDAYDRRRIRNLHTALGVTRKDPA